MQVLFCYDGPMQVDDRGNYYGIVLNDEMFERYKILGDELNVAIRLNEIKDIRLEKRLSKINITPFKVYDVPNLKNLRGYLFDRKKARKTVEEAVIKSDYIVARLPSMVGFIAIDFARKHNKPYITEVVGCAWDAHWNHSLVGKIIAPFMYFSTKKRVFESTNTVYVTEEFLQKRYPTKGENTNCSNVALTKFEDSTLPNRIKKINNNSKEIIIGTTAAVNVKFKGQQYIIEALGELKKQGNSNFKYQLVGPGNQEYLKDLAEKFNVVDQVEFLGPMIHKEVFSWLDTIDIYTQPSRQEGLPRALIEAMSRGLPAFGAKTAGIPELLEEKYIFSNSKNNIKEIIEILHSFNEKEMLLQSKKNYKEAKKYAKNIIDDRRRSFFEDFKKQK